MDCSGSGYRHRSCSEGEEEPHEIFMEERATPYLKRHTNARQKLNLLLNFISTFDGDAGQEVSKELSRGKAPNCCVDCRAKHLTSQPENPVETQYT